MKSCHYRVERGFVWCPLLHLIRKLSLSFCSQQSVLWVTVAKGVQVSVDSSYLAVLCMHLKDNGMILISQGRCMPLNDVRF